MPIRREAETLHHALARLEEWDHDAAAYARASLTWLGWDDDGPLHLRRYDLLLHLWYELTTKVSASPERKHARAVALGRVLELTPAADYAPICREPQTLDQIALWETSDARARRALGRLLDASGIEPPETPLLAWSPDPWGSSRRRRAPTSRVRVAGGARPAAGPAFSTELHRLVIGTRSWPASPTESRTCASPPDALRRQQQSAWSARNASAHGDRLNHARAQQLPRPADQIDQATAASRPADGGHGNLPIGGHRKSPLAATGSPHGWPSDLPTVSS